MRHIYYFIPPCPKCGSRRTGRYMRKPYMSAGSIRKMNLNAGELVRFEQEVPDRNLYCADCGHTWRGTAQFKFWPKDKIREEADVRGTEKIYEKYVKREQEIEALSGGGLFRRKKQPEEIFMDGVDGTGYKTGSTNVEDEIDTIEAEAEKKHLQAGYRNYALIRKVKERRNR